MPARVGVDARRTTLWPQTGIARYTRSLLGAIDALAPADVQVQPIDVIGSSYAGVRVAGRGTPAVRRAVEEQVTMTRLSRSLDLLHLPWSEGPAWPRCPLVTTVFDLAIVDQPGAYNRAFRSYYVNLVEIHVRRAARIIVPSESTLEAAQRRWGRRPFRMVSLGVDDVYQPGTAEERAEEPTVIYTGGYDPRKRIADIVDAVARVPGVTLVLSGNPPDHLRQLIEMRLGGRAVITGFLSDKQLAALYRRGWLVVYASDMEGFGFPVVESFASGTPVIATATGSIPEVAGDAAVLVEAGDVGALAEAIQSVIADSGWRESLRCAGLRRSQQFRWRRTAEHTVDVYREVLTP